MFLPDSGTAAVGAGAGVAEVGDDATIDRVDVPAARHGLPVPALSVEHGVGLVGVSCVQATSAAGGLAGSDGGARPEELGGWCGRHRACGHLLVHFFAGRVAVDGEGAFGDAVGDSESGLSRGRDGHGRGHGEEDRLEEHGEGGCGLG